MSPKTPGLYVVTYRGKGGKSSHSIRVWACSCAQAEEQAPTVYGMQVVGICPVPGQEPKTASLAN